MSQRLKTDKTMDRIDDETLMAYADGELSPAKAAEIEIFLRANEDARNQIGRYRESAAIARGAFAYAVNQPVPERLLRAVRGRAVRSARWAWLRRLPIPATLSTPGLALAASVMLLLGVGAGYLANEFGAGSGGNGANGLTVADLGGARLSRVLERTASGKAVSWTTAGGERAVTVAVRSTFRDKRGAYCREYRVQIVENAREQGLRGIACRTGKARWKTRVAVAAAPPAATKPNDKDFRPAAGGNASVDLIADALEDMIKGRPLSAARESALMGNHWH